MSASAQWDGQRGQDTRRSQLKLALNTLCAVIGKDSAEVMVKQVPKRAIEQSVKLWVAEGLSNSSINTRLSGLRAIGLDVDGCWRSRRSPLKWWLTPDDATRLLTYLRAEPEPFRDASLLADYVEFVSHTGLRVEEALRLTWQQVSLRFDEDADGSHLRSFTEMTVPGTKTQNAQAETRRRLIARLVARQASRHPRPR